MGYKTRRRGENPFESKCTIATGVPSSMSLIANEEKSAKKFTYDEEDDVDGVTTMTRLTDMMIQCHT